jgi:hypothetical protein
MCLKTEKIVRMLCTRQETFRFYKIRKDPVHMHLVFMTNNLASTLSAFFMYFNPLKMQYIRILFENHLLHQSKHTMFSLYRINIVFMYIIAVYFQNYKHPSVQGISKMLGKLHIKGRKKFLSIYVSKNVVIKVKLNYVLTQVCPTALL